MARSLRSLAGVLYGGVQGFQVRKDIIITTYEHPSYVVVKFQIFFIKKSKTVGQQNLSRELPPSTTSPTQFP